LVAGIQNRIPYIATPVVATPPLSQTRGQQPPETPPLGFLRIGVSPWANVTINGRRIEQVTIRVDTVPAGEYTLRFEHPDLNTVDTTVTVRPGEATLVRIQLSGTR